MIQRIVYEIGVSKRKKTSFGVVGTILFVASHVVFRLMPLRRLVFRDIGWLDRWCVDVFELGLEHD